MSGYLQLKESNCKNCYKCIRHCPVKAISFSHNQAHVLEDECILCGKCCINCPQGAKRVRDDLPHVRALLQSGQAVSASIAPSIAAAFPGISFAAICTALKKLGFADVQETAIGATAVKRRYEEMIREGSSSVIISSCCPSVNNLIRKYYPQAVPYLAKVVSPMIAHGNLIKQAHPDSKVVFIGPCIAKKAEADEIPGTIDGVLTFEDLASWLKQDNISLADDGQEEEPSGKARLFPIAGGIINSMNLPQDSGYVYMAVDGIENCIAALEDVIAGGLEKCFVEMSACTQSCVGGPVMGKERSFPVRDRQIIWQSAGSEDFDMPQPAPKELERSLPVTFIPQIRPGAAAIKDVLRKMGKTLPEHELNCGSCGYDTCQEKAAAVLEGKAETNMCLPYLMARAESFSDNIIHNTPNAIIVLNRTLEIQQINHAARAMMNVREEASVRGRNVVCLLDPSPFMQVIESGKNIYDQLAYLSEYRRYVKMTILPDPQYDIVIAIIRDITAEHDEREGKNAMGQKAVEIADKVIEKQMRTVQEIASLLGETTAETKIALERLKETFLE